MPEIWPMGRLNSRRNFDRPTHTYDPSTIRCTRPATDIVADALTLKAQVAVLNVVDRFTCCGSPGNVVDPVASTEAPPAPALAPRRTGPRRADTSGPAVTRT